MINDGSNCIVLMNSTATVICKIVAVSKCCLFFSFAPGNIWTPLWENLSAIASDPEKMIQDGRNAAVNYILIH